MCCTGTDGSISGYGTRCPPWRRRSSAEVQPPCRRKRLVLSRALSAKLSDSATSGQQAILRAVQIAPPQLSRSSGLEEPLRAEVGARQSVPLLIQHTCGRTSGRLTAGCTYTPRAGRDHQAVDEQSGAFLRYYEPYPAAWHRWLTCQHAGHRHTYSRGPAEVTDSARCPRRQVRAQSLSAPSLPVGRRPMSCW